MKFTASNWEGNGWASIEIEPIDTAFSLKVLRYIIDTFDCDEPYTLDTLDGYMAEFDVQYKKSYLHLDNWSFSLAFSDEAIRDAVLTNLQGLSDDYFDKLQF